MSQALDLLNSIETNEPEDCITVNDDRKIYVPARLRRLGVQYDHNIETVTFSCPRFWDGYDMSKMRIYINYLRPDGIKGKYLTTNINVSDNTMTFDWVVSNNVTHVRGNLSFLICIVKTDDEGVEERHWNSEICRDCYISEGMECEEDVVLGYPDIINYLLARMQSVSNSSQNANGLTTAQVEALHGMFKVCAYDDSKDVSGAYAAFLAAFGITDTEDGGGEEEPETPVEPDEPVTPEVTLTSISATYSGGDVTVGTAVTALTGIVVTGHYSDGTSETVTGYTLSGTIAEGENTVTVSYGGKTTTFTVAGVAESGGETEGEVVSMCVEVTHGDMSKAGHYSDGGSTKFSDARFPTTNGKSAVSEKVFEKDTKLRITLAPTGSVFQCMLFCSTLMDADRKLVSDTDDLFYWCESSKAGFAYGWSADEHTWEYTVKAGYRFCAIGISSSALPTKVEVV